jgi:ribonuclease D
MVAEAAALAALLEALRNEPAVAVDTESNSFHVYTERVCLLQISTRTSDYVVDPLAVDLRPLGAVLTDGRETVFHGADYDVRCLKREYGWSFPNLFDTMPAAKKLGRPGLGYSALVQSELGVALSKDHQRSDWGRRPLTQAQLRYAAADTHFLLGLRDRLREELAAKGHLDPVLEECRRIAAVEHRPRVFDPEGYRRWRGVKELDATAQAILKALYVAREELAKRSDRPPFKVLSEQSMIEIARRRPATRAELEAIPGVTPRVLGKMGEAILAALAGRTGR